MNSNQLNALFEVDKTNELPYLRKEARNITGFYDIIVRDKGVQRNVDGRNKQVKQVAQKEVAFIYFYLNEEFASNYEDKERRIVIRKHLGIDWELDELVWSVIKNFEKDSITLEEKMLDNFYETLNGYNTLLTIISKKINESIELLERPQTELSIAELSEVNNLIDRSRSDFKWVLDATNQLKTTFKNIEELRIAKTAKARKQGKNKLETDRSMYIRRQDNE